jgi:predicted metal-dependent phosphoesterase TrpH
VSPSDSARIDLHCHTTASDGSLTPGELVARAALRGLAAIAITDHDSIGGVKEGAAAGERLGLEVVPGVEIGIAHDPDRGLVEIDILGYFVEPDHAELAHALARLQDAKNEKLDRQLAVLAGNGFPIAREEVLKEAAGDSIRRPHIWKVLSRHHPSLDAQEFFDRTSFGGSWHVSKIYSVPLEECVALIERAGGASVLAHPGCYNRAFAKGGALIDPAIDAVVGVCAAAGVKGLEVYYPYDRGGPYEGGLRSITPEEYAHLIAHFEGLARRHGLLVTGGTDFHGAAKPEVDVGDVDVPYRLLRLLREACTLR